MRTDVYQRITDPIVSELENAFGPRLSRGMPSMRRAHHAALARHRNPLSPGLSRPKLCKWPAGLYRHSL